VRTSAKTFFLAWRLFQLGASICAIVGGLAIFHVRNARRSVLSIHTLIQPRSMLRTILRTPTLNTTSRGPFAATTLQGQKRQKAQALGQTHSERPSRILIEDLCVTPDEDGMRLDRFLRHRLAQHPDCTAVNNTTISKLLEKRKVKLLPLPSTPAITTPTVSLDNDIQLSAGLNRSQAAKTITTGATRTEAGQTWRIRIIVEARDTSKDTAGETNRGGQKNLSSRPTATLPLKDWIAYEDERIIILNKPSGVCVQSGTGVSASIDNSLSGRHHHRLRSS